MEPEALELLARGLGGEDPGRVIEEQEARGQRRLVSSDLLPKQMDGLTRAQMEALGFRCLGEADDLFDRWELPPGWRKEAGDGSYSSYLLDERGRKRAAIFYKAAFYDRKANMTWLRRFGMQSDEPVGGWGAHKPGMPRVGVVRDGEEIVFQTESYPDWDQNCGMDREAQRYALAAHKAGQETARSACLARLSERYPDWESPLAYWDE